MKKVSLNNLLIIFLPTLIGCNVEVEVPHDRCAVVVGSIVEPTVLPEGRHRVGHRSELKLFDITPQKLNLSFDFLLEDTTTGKIDGVVTFVAKPDSLPAFYKRYETTHLDAAVLVYAQSTVRKTLAHYSRAKIEQTDMKAALLKALQRDWEMRKYVEIKDLDTLTWRLDTPIAP